MSVITVKDMNGKDFNVDISKISDINGDSEGSIGAAKDSALKNRINFQHDVQIVNINGETLDATKLLNDVSNGKTDIVALDVNMEATHSGKNHNYCIYYEDSMEKDSESFMNPFHKPVLKNHDDYSEPLGRITESYAGPSQLTNERSAIHLTARVTDKDAIPKFLDKRYGTVSIGGSMGTVTCNICGKTILKDGKFHFCGHWKGETYKDQVCYWGARDIEYHEVSIVNNPADDFAQIMKVTVLTDKDINNDNLNKEENSMQGSDSTENNVETLVDQTLENTQTETQDSAATDSVDEIIDSVTQPNQNETETQDSEQQDSSSVEDNNETAPVDEKDSKINELQKALDESNEKITALEDELKSSKASVQALTKAVEDAKSECDTFKQRCVTLATANKEAIVDNIISKETFETDDAKEERKKELMMKSMKDLKAMEPVQRTVASVTSPCLATEDHENQKESNGNTTDTNKQENNQKIVTVNDAAQEVIKRLFK